MKDAQMQVRIQAGCRVWTPPPGPQCSLFNTGPKARHPPQPFFVCGPKLFFLNPASAPDEQEPM